MIAPRRIWKWLESKKRTQEREVPGEHSAPATPLRVGIKPGGEREGREREGGEIIRLVKIADNVGLYHVYCKFDSDTQ